MEMDIVAGSKNDENYTPRYAIVPILEYIKPESTIWCPFDTEDSLYVKTLREYGHNVLSSHIDSGEDFFSLNPNVEYIVSNPPYSLKTEVLLRLFELGKPFAMLLGVVGLFESQRRFEMFRDNEFEILYFNRRVSFFQDFKEQKPKLNPPFSSVYITHKILPKQINFAEIDKNDIR